MKGIYTIAIAGISGAGKSVTVNRVAEKLEDATVLHFDDFKQDYNLLTKTLQSLQERTPNRYIVVEEPTGRSREGMEDLVDLLVFIDVPFEIALTRVLLRAIYNSDDESIDSFYNQIGPQFESNYREKPTKLMHIISWLLENYLKSHRAEYIENRDYFLQNADFVVEGTDKPENITKEIVEQVLLRKP